MYIEKKNNPENWTQINWKYFISHEICNKSSPIRNYIQRQDTLIVQSNRGEHLNGVYVYQLHREQKELSSTIHPLHGFTCAHLLLLSRMKWKRCRTTERIRLGPINSVPHRLNRQFNLKHYKVNTSKLKSKQCSENAIKTKQINK